MNNTRFATAIHILTLLAKAGEEYVSSEWIAGSINVNAVVVRKELAILQHAGFVVGRKGKDGGSKLNVSSDKIRLADIYLTVKNSDVLGKKNKNTNPLCPVGVAINSKLDTLFLEMESLVSKSLMDKTLKDFVLQFD